VSLPGHRECLEPLLLSRGAPIDMELPEVGTALYSACQAQAAACVEVLLHSGNEWEQKDRIRRTILLFCQHVFHKNVDFTAAVNQS